MSGGWLEFGHGAQKWDRLSALTREPNFYTRPVIPGGKHEILATPVVARTTLL